jgi:histidyl-tRNA synthetase
MFRYERPQAGRQRQFHQVGVEVFGIKQPTADAEVILMAVNYLKELCLNDLTVELNSLGCPKCREEFKQRLKDVIRPYLPQLCEDCQTRFDKNPLRLLDCKSTECQEIYAKPEIQAVIQGDFICEECSEHFEDLKKYLDALGIKYERNKLLVRGLDYYNRTVLRLSQIIWALKMPFAEAEDMIHSLKILEEKTFLL